MNKDNLRLSNRLVAAQAEMVRHGVDTIFTRDLDTGEVPEHQDNKATIVCVVQLSWLYIWDHTRNMSSAAMAQWRHMWRTLVRYEDDQKVRVDAWCARIEWVAKCEPPQAWSSYTAGRSNAWSMMDAESAAALLNTCVGEEALRQAGGDVEWSVGRAMNHGMPMLKVPPETAALVMHGLWKELMCPAPYSKSLFAVPARLTDKPSFADEFPEMAMSRTLHPRGEVHLDAADAFALSDLPEVIKVMQALAWQGRDRGDPTMRDCLRWIGKLQNGMERDLEKGSTRTRCSRELVQYVLLAHKCRSSDNMMAVMQESASLLLSPECAADLMQPMLTGEKTRPPSKAAISRAQLPMDTAYMILHRLANHALEVHPRSYYLAWDSSPQYGRDVMGVLLFSVEVKILPKLFVKLQKLKRLWEAPMEGGDLDLAQFTEERLQEESRLIASIELGVAEHRPPLVNLGFGASGFAQKLRTLCHAIRLEHFRGAGLKAVISALVSSMQDYGAESSIMLTRPVSYRELLPYFMPTPLSKVEKLIDALEPPQSLLRMNSVRFLDASEDDVGPPAPGGGGNGDQPDDFFEHGADGAVAPDGGGDGDQLDDFFERGGDDAVAHADQPEEEPGFEDPGLATDSDDKRRTTSTFISSICWTCHRCTT